MKNAFTISATFPAGPKAIYAAWLDGKKHGRMTGDKATCSTRVGGKFTAWDGYIFGKNLELEPDRRIVQSWRTTEFAKSDADSLLEILLDATKTGCTLTLKHSNVPSGQSNEYKQGWKDYYFVPMQKYFSSTNASKKMS
jgi:activator of HSP90 ATPase